MTYLPAFLLMIQINIHQSLLTYLRVFLIAGDIQKYKL